MALMYHYILLFISPMLLTTSLDSANMVICYEIIRLLSIKNPVIWTQKCRAIGIDGNVKPRNISSKFCTTWTNRKTKQKKRKFGLELDLY